MDSIQAKQMLKQVDCHGIPRGFNGGYSELNKYCLESIEKIERIEQIYRQWSEIGDNADSWAFSEIGKVLEKE